MPAPGPPYRRLTRRGTFLVLLLPLLAASRANATAAGPRQMSVRPLPRLVFEQSIQSAGPPLRFRASSSGLSVDLDPTGASLQAEDASPIHMTLLEADPSARIAGLDPLAGRVSRIHGADPRAWRADVAAFGRVEYRAIYPGIDLVFHGGRGHLEYDFVVAPGADPDRIGLRFDGAESVQVDASGALTLATASGTLRHEPPIVYQVVDAGRRQIPGAYRLSADGRVGFLLGAHDPSLPLIIDPRLVYSRQLEDSGRQQASVQGAAIAVDADGFAYVTGTLDDDAFVAKLTPQGDALLFLTLLGGSDQDAGAGIALGPRGEIFITGVTRSADFPGARPSRRRGGGQQDAFAVRLSPDGSRVLDTAILGGYGDDAGSGIAVDSSGTVVVTGTTSSQDFPTTGGALQRSLAGMDDAFVARLSANGLRRIYSTYLGGSGIDRGAAIAIDAAGRAHVAGSTSSVDFPIAQAAGASRQSAYGGAGRAGTGDGFVAKLDGPGSRLLFATFLGGDDDDEATAIALDAQGAALVAGTTASTDFPAMPPQQPIPAGGTDAFIARLGAGGNLQNASRLGSPDDEIATGLAVDPQGDIFLAGITTSDGWPAEGGPSGLTPGPASFVLKLRHGGMKLREAARLDEGRRGGGEPGSIDLVHGIARGQDGDIYLTGATRDQDLAALAQGPGEEVSGFVARVAFSTLSVGCPGSMNFTNAGGTGLWEDPNNWDDFTRIPDRSDDVCIPAGFDVSISSGIHDVNSLQSDGTLYMAAGSTGLNIFTASQLGDFTMDGGVLGGPGTLNMIGQFFWRGGRISGPTTRASILNITGTLIIDRQFQFQELRGRILNTLGTVHQVIGSISGGGGAVINHTGTWMAEAGSLNVSSAGGSITFNNNGVFEKKTTGNFTIAVPFDTAGTVDVKEGKLTINGICNQTAGSMLVNGGTITSQVLTIRGGILAGVGTITGNVLMAGGTISPGFSPGSILVNGNYSQSSTSTLDIEVGGLAPGTQADSLVMDLPGGAVTLAGTLNVTLAGGYTPAFGDRIGILTFASRSGTFSSVNLPAPVAGVSFDVEYSSTAVTLVAASQKDANLSIDKRDSPDPVLRDRTLSYTLTVTNSGPDDATDVKITDPLPSYTTFVSAAGPGWTCDISTGPVICILPTLAVGTNSSVTIEVTPTFAPTSLLNVATVFSKDKDPLPGNNTAVQGTSVALDLADLAMAVVDDPDPVRIDSTMTLGITVTNAGPALAPAVSVLVTLPPGSTFAGFSGIGWLCLPATGTASCQTNAIGAGNTSSVSLFVKSPSSSGQAVNTLVVSSNAADPNPADNTAVATTTVLPADADISVTASDFPDPVGSFDPLAYTLLVANSGPDPAHDLVLVDTLPAGSGFVDVTGIGWICQHLSGVVTCTASTLSPGTSSLVEIKVSAPASAGTFTNRAEVSSLAGDPVPANNISLESTSVALSHADLSATVEDSVDPVFAGEPLSYTVTVSNAGPNQANFLTVAATLPPGAGFSSANGLGWTCNYLSGTVTCTLPALPVGTAIPIQIATTAPEAGGLLVGSVSVSAATDDPNPSNNVTTNETIDFLPTADLSVTLTDSPDPVSETTLVFYKIQVTNHGPDPVKRTKVVSTVPAGITVTSVPLPGGPWSCTVAGSTVTCFIAEVPPGPAPDLNLGVPVPAGIGTMSNLATVSAVVVDGDLSNNTATEQTATAPLGADIWADQQVDPDPVESGGEYTYRLYAWNRGPLDATGVQLVEVLPPEVEFVSAVPEPAATQTEPNGALKLTYLLQEVQANSGTSVEVTVRCVAPNAALQSTATVSSVQFDPAPADNTQTKLANCIGLNGGVQFSQRLITPYTTSLAMPAVVTVSGGVVDPNSVAITRINDQSITPIPATPASGKFNFNRQTILRAVEAILLDCTPEEGIPLKLRVSGRTMTGDFFTGIDTITYAKKSPCADGSDACVTLKPTSVKVTSFSTTPVQATIGLCLGRIIQGTVRVTKVNGGVVPSVQGMPHPKKPDRVLLDRPSLNDSILRAIGFCPAKELRTVTLTFRGLTQSFKSFEIDTPFVVNCGLGS